jgi:glycosyltransferase involved in cell wall biosynthesis
VTKSLSIVVPALNEAQNIEFTYAEIVIAAEVAGLTDYEMLFIDDCSSDTTLQIMQDIAKRDKRVRVFHNERNLGLGGSYKRGIDLATKEYYMLIPGDNAWPAEGMCEVLSMIGGTDIIIPYIVEAGDKGPIRRFLSRGFTVFVNTMFGLHVHYYNGIVVHRTENLRKLVIRTNSFAYQAEVLVKLLKNGATYTECGLNTVPRSDGKSKALKISNLVRVWIAIVRLRWKFFIHGCEFRAH